MAACGLRAPPLLVSKISTPQVFSVNIFYGLSLFITCGVIFVGAGKYRNIALMRDVSVWTMRKNLEGQLVPETITITNKGTFFFVKVVSGCEGGSWVKGRYCRWSAQSIH